ncbi:MAG TPA: acyltransferase family protein [Desulfosporosinus sp.]|nr:acyltransferase family protein [Desulfosporosinus sp.]
MEDKRRNYLFDNLKVLLIVLVVLGHALKNIDNDIVLRSIYILIFMFHMPLFIFISGYFSKNVDKCRNNAVKQLLIPFIVFNIIWYASVGNFKFPLYSAGWTLWYILSLFFWRFFLKNIIKIKWILGLSIVLGLLVGIVDKYGSILSFSRTFAFLPFFLVGYYSDNSTINKIKAFPKVISILGLTSIGVLAFSIANYNLLDYKFLYMAQPYESTGLGVVQGILLRAIFYLLAIAMSSFVINLVPRRKLAFSKLGASTMVIYLGHIYMLKFLNGFIPTFNSSFANLGITLVYSILICVVLSLPIFTKLYNAVFGNFNYVLDRLYGKAKSITTNT